ncbi:MAG: nicotinate phosphoribosyltransferase, partial [Fusobacterium mortiferum]|nr:nicotinate phosphoribosyltransferase [Fusobacterium mortiferum]
MEKSRVLTDFARVINSDRYQYTESDIFLMENMEEKIAVFDVYFRKTEDGGFAVVAGVQEVINLIEILNSTPEEEKRMYFSEILEEEHLVDYLSKMKFTGDILAMRDGEIVYPNEPVLTVKAPLIQAKILETPILNIINMQMAIATKASRICSAAGTYDPVLDFGLRRAHGTEAGLYGARACIIGGCVGTSNVEAEYCWDTVSKGTISHAFIMAFDKEIDAFRAYAKYNPDNLILLADTYDTLNSGVKNAIKVFTEEREAGRLKGAYGIRLDSG